jgi:hypothetical protein
MSCQVAGILGWVQDFRAFMPGTGEAGMVMSVRDWAQRFSDASDRDQTIGAMARYFTCTFLWVLGTAKVIVEVIDGKVYRLNVDPAPMDAYDFALRASPQTWREFARPIPAPMYHGIWSASFRRDLKIEGNILVLMQNLRNLTVQFELLRRVGVPV